MQARILPSALQAHWKKSSRGMTKRRRDLPDSASQMLITACPLRNSAVTSVFPLSGNEKKAAGLGMLRNHLPDFVSHRRTSCPLEARYLPSAENSNRSASCRQRKVPTRASAPFGKESPCRSVLLDESRFWQ